MKIYGDLLSVLHSESGVKKIVLIRVQAKVNVPFDRLKTYIAELVDLGLIRDETSLRLTDKGKQYIEEYDSVLDFMRRMGIAYS